MVEGSWGIFGPCMYVKGEVKGRHVNCDKYSCLRMETMSKEREESPGSAELCSYMSFKRISPFLYTGQNPKITGL